MDWTKNVINKSFFPSQFHDTFALYFVGFVDYLNIELCLLVESCPYCHLKWGGGACSVWIYISINCKIITFSDEGQNTPPPISIISSPTVKYIIYSYVYITHITNEKKEKILKNTKYYIFVWQLWQYTKKNMRPMSY